MVSSLVHHRFIPDAHTALGLPPLSYRVDVDVGWLQSGPDGSPISEVELCDDRGRDFGDERDRPLDANAGSVAGWVEFGRSPARCVAHRHRVEVDAATPRLVGTQQRPDRSLSTTS